MSESKEERGRPANQAPAGLDDAELVRRTLAGELPAFDTLVGRYQKRAVSASYRLLGNSHDAMEVCQDAFLRAYQSLERLKEPARFGPWLIRIVSNLSLNFRRSRRSTAALPVDDALGTDETATAGRPRRDVGHSVPADPLSSGELAGQIERAVAELPEKQRLALVLFAIEGWPQRDVAEVLGCSLEAVKWNVFQARKTLKVKLAEHL